MLENIKEKRDIVNIRKKIRLEEYKQYKYQRNCVWNQCELKRLLTVSIFDGK